ncbi:unnamed protein product [Mytilus edulis]|uniref:Uncharacterized protein n=1 Tax=Mytilus edulis TaxID=6550 RepID=A0A8S3UCL7_MYTED|nr:unnamed protein product [Mytilus edulis]
MSKQLGDGKPSLIGISGVDGEGTLGKDLSGSAEWLMIPYSTAAPQDDTLYNVGGQLSYRVGGSNFSVPLLPDTITVKPNPSLVVHYFHEKYVGGDDPLTTAIVEPIIPFSLAVSVMNDGLGTAQALRISSAQPEIIENEKGLLITFKIVGAKLGNNQIAPSLSVDFGDIHSFETKTATWLLTSTLKGTFYNYTATFENINPLGDPQLSLFDELEYHELVHLVRIDTENENNDFDDFLVNDIVDSKGMPDKLYNSKNGSDVYDVYIGNITQLYTSSYVRSQNKVYTVVHLKVTANASTWTYTRMENNITSSNPVDNQYLLQCESSSNRKLMIEKNVWQTTHILDKFFLHIFDFFPSNETAEEGVEVTYDITFGPRNMYAPIFNMTGYSQTVPFDVSIGSIIITLSGHDIDHDQMSFQIVDEDIKPVFAIDETIGSIKTKVLLNSTTVYEFKVIIVDHGIPSKSCMTNITITVTDYGTSSVSSTDTTPSSVSPLTSYITEYTNIAAESSAARETVESETSTSSHEMNSPESNVTPIISTEDTTGLSVHYVHTNDKHTTSPVIAEYTTVKESLATSETVGSETSTIYIEKYTSDLRSMATTTTEYTSESSIPAGETNDNHITSTESVKYTTIKDEDECVLETHSCNQRCINTAGGYLCSCEDGFELTGNTTCINIDECTLLINNCEQICVDTIGSFNCSCRDGFVLNSDQSSCSRDYDPCANNNINCSYGCVLENSEPVCYCPENYKLSIHDNQTCSAVFISVEIYLTTNFPYTSEMADHSTDEFKHARVDIKVALYFRYSNIPGFLSLTVISFSFGSTVVQYIVVFNQSLSDSLIMETASVTNNITQITVLDKSYGVTGETFVNYQTKNQEPLTCTLCRVNHTCVILRKSTYECRPPLSKLENYAAYEKDIEQAFKTEMSDVGDIQYLNVTDFRNHTEGVTTSLVVIFNTVANKTLQYDKVLNLLVKMETEDKSCTDIIDMCIAVNGSITLGNTTTTLEPVICSTCSVTQQCIQDTQTSRYQCVNQPTTEHTASSTSERTTTTVQSKSSSDLILGLGIGLPLAIAAFAIFITIMICMFCRSKKRKSELIVQGQQEDDNWQIRQAFGRRDSSLRGTKSLEGFYNEVAYKYAFEKKQCD